MMLRRPIAVALAMTPLILSIGCAAGTATREAEPDNPGQAHAWRRLAWKDEQGRIDPDGLIDALWQRRDNIEFWQDRAIHDAAGGIAGVTGPTWNDHGPGNVGGRTRSLVIHPTQTDRMWAGSVGGGLWRTEDGGATWTAVDDWWASLAIGCLAIDPANPDVMYAGTGEGFFNGDAIGGAGIYRSIDGGQTWNRLISTIGWENVCRIAISPDDSDVILAGIRYGGIRRSDDGGVSWSTPRSAQGCFQVAFDPTDGQNVVAHVIDHDGDWFHSALYSTDGGVSFQEAAGLDHMDGFGTRIELAYAPSDTGIVYASVAIDGGTVWKSTDGGQSYTQQTVSGGSGCSWYADPIWVDPTDADEVIVGGYAIHGSSNGGVSLSQRSNGYIMTTQPHPDIHFFTSDPGYDGSANRTFYVCTDGGVWRADDIAAAGTGGGWAPLDVGYRTTQFYGAAGDGASGIIVGGTQDNGTLRVTTTDDQAVLTFGGDGGFCAIDPTDPDYTYGEYVRLYLHRSTNGGQSAGYIHDGIDDAGGPANFIAPFILDPNDPDTLLGGGASLWRSTNVKSPAPAWSAIKSPSSANISAIAVAPGDSNVIWVGHNDGKVFRTDDGTLPSPTWTIVDDNDVTDPLPSRFVTRIVIDPADAEVVYTSFGGFSNDNLMKSVDGGASWSDVTGAGPGGLPDVPIRGVARHPDAAGWLYAGTEVGLFASTDGGATWSTSDFGPAAVSVDEVVFMHGSRTLLVATHGRGLWTIETPKAGDMDGDGVVEVTDLLMLLAAWGACPVDAPCAADFDADGFVSTTDLLLLLANWG